MLPRTVFNIFVDYPTYNARGGGGYRRLEASLVRCYVNASAADLAAINLKAPTVFAMLKQSLENDLGSMLHHYDTNRDNKKALAEPKTVVVGKEGQLRYNFVVREVSGDDRGETVLLNNPPNFGRAGFLNREVEVYLLGPSTASSSSSGASLVFSSSAATPAFPKLLPVMSGAVITDDGGDNEEMMDLDFDDD